MKFKMMTAAACLIVAATAFAAVQDAVTLKWTPKEGSTLKYKMTMKASLDQGDMDYESTVTRNTISVKDGKVTLEQVESDVKASFGGTDISSMIPETPKATITYDSTGKAISRKLDKPSEMENPRLEAISEFTYPTNALKIGETWKVSRPANKEKGTFTIEGTYTLVGTEMVDGVKTYKVTSEAKETDAPTNMTLSGTSWIRVEDGEVVKSDVSMKNVVITDQLPPIDATVTMTLIK